MAVREAINDSEKALNKASILEKMKQEEEQSIATANAAVGLIDVGGEDNIRRAKNVLDVDYGQENENIQIGLAHVYEKEGKYYKALEAYQKARELDPDNEDLQFLATAEKNGTIAEELYNRGLTLQAEKEEISPRSRRYSRRINESIDAYEQALVAVAASRANGEPPIRFTQVDSMRQAGEIPESIDDRAAATAIIEQTKAEALLTAGRVSQAIASFERARRIWPQRVEQASTFQQAQEQQRTIETQRQQTEQLFREQKYKESIETIPLLMNNYGDQIPFLYDAALAYTEVDENKDSEDKDSIKRANLKSAERLISYAIWLDSIDVDIAQKEGRGNTQLDEKLLLLLSEIKQAGGKPEEASATDRRIESIVPALPPEKIEEIQKRLVDQGKLATGQQMLQTWLNDRQESPEVSMRRVELARVFLWENHLDEGRDAINEVLRQDPENSWALSLAGQFAVRSRNYQQAKELFEHALRSDRNNHEAATFLEGNIEETLDRRNQVTGNSSRENIQRQVLEDAVVFKADMVVTGEAHRLQERLIQEGRLTDAEFLLTSWERSHPGEVEKGDLQLEHARLLFWTNRAREAADILNKEVNRDPNNTWVLSFLGQVETSLGNYDQARQIFERSLRINPDNHEARLFVHGNKKEERKELESLQQRKESLSSQERIRLITLELAQTYSANQKGFFNRWFGGKD